MPSDIQLKIRALERLSEARLRLENAKTPADQLEALRLYDQAIKNFQQLVHSQRSPSESAGESNDESLPPEEKLPES